MTAISIYFTYKRYIHRSNRYLWLEVFLICCEAASKALTNLQGLPS